MYTINEKTHAVEVDGKKEYESDGFHNPQQIDIETLENVGFHFTPQRNSPSISATGLKPKIGANSKGGLGREATEKTFFSKGVDGSMQIFNRTIHIALETPLQYLQDEKEKAVDLTQSQKNPLRRKESLSIIEAFEYVRRYMSGNRYFVFNLKEPVYNAQIDESIVASQLTSLNEGLDAIEGITVNTSSFSREEKQILQERISGIISKLDEKSKDENLKSTDRERSAKKSRKINSISGLFTSEIDECNISNPKTTINRIDTLIEALRDEAKKLQEPEKTRQTDLIEKINKVRADISIQIRRVTKKVVDEQIRGEAVTDSMIGANFERIDFNEDAINWVDFNACPHNCHTLVLDKEYGIQGIDEPKGASVKSSDVSILSLDGEEPATSIDVIQYLYENIPDKSRREKFGMDIPGRKKDIVLIGNLLEYVKLYESCLGSPDEFVKRALEIQDNVGEQLEGKTKYGRKATREELYKFQAELMKEKGISTRSAGEIDDDWQIR